MARYIIGRLIGVAGVLIAVSMVTFLLMHAVPGGPFDASQSQQIPISDAMRQELSHRYHLDKPIYRQYLSYMGGVVRGDFGTSFRFGEPITTFLARSWPVTIELGLITLAVSLVVGLTIGIAAALKPGSWLDMITSILIVTFIVAPTFVVAILFVIIFSVKLHWFPSGGWGSPKQAVMPVIAYALGPTATIARYTRASMLEALRAAYVRTAKAKGLTSRAVVLRHAFRNALVPLLTVVGPLVAWMVTGSFFVESIFRIPGIGNQLTLSIYNRDYPVIMALSLIWCGVIALSYLATDLLYAVVDPRVRLTPERPLMAAIGLDRGRAAALDTGSNKRSLWRDAARRYAHNPLSVIGLVVGVFLIAVAVFAPLLAPNGYDHQVYVNAWRYPSWAHPFGTDPYGREVLDRVIYGARISLSVALVVNVASLLIGAPLAAAGWYGGGVDYVLMRVVDVVSAFPTLLFAILMLTVLGSGLINIYIALTVTSWIGIARLVRGQIFSLREQEFVTAARSMGATDWRIISQHLLPNSLTPIIVAVTFGIPGAILGEASLSFLGIGVNAPLPSWGKMLNEYLPYVQPYWYLSAIPGLAIALTMYAFTLMGDGLQSALDPTAGGSE